MSALIGAAGSILGGLFGRSKGKSASSQSYGHVKGIMQAAKAWGFNPLTLLGAVGAVGGTASDNSSFGQGIANAAMIMSDASAAKAKEAAENNALKQQNAKLNERLTQMTIRPPVPGVYQARAMETTPTPAVPADLGLPPIETVDAVDPRRGVEIKDVPNSSGVMTVENRFFDRLYFPTIDGDEPLDLLDVPALVVGAPQIAYQKGKFMSYGGGSESRPNMTRAESIRLRDERREKAKREKAQRRKNRGPIYNPVPNYGMSYP